MMWVGKVSNVCEEQNQQLIKSTENFSIALLSFQSFQRSFLDEEVCVSGFVRLKSEDVREERRCERDRKMWQTAHVNSDDFILRYSQQIFQAFLNYHFIRTELSGKLNFLLFLVCLKFSRQVSNSMMNFPRFTPH